MICCSTYGRMESLKLKRFHGILKVSGIVLCAVGVTILALYQGPELKSFIHHRLFHHTSRVDTHPSRNWILGIVLQSFATVMWALWAVLQVYILLCACALVHSRVCACAGGLTSQILPFLICKLGIAGGGGPTLQAEPYTT